MGLGLGVGLAMSRRRRRARKERGAPSKAADDDGVEQFLSRGRGLNDGLHQLAFWIASEASFRNINAKLMISRHRPRPRSWFHAYWTRELERRDFLTLYQQLTEEVSRNERREGVKGDS